MFHIHRLIDHENDEEDDVDDVDDVEESTDDMDIPVHSLSKRSANLGYRNGRFMRYRVGPSNRRSQSVPRILVGVYGTYNQVNIHTARD